MLSNSQIDKLGGKLRSGQIDAQCLRDLERFRSLFSASYRHIERVLVEKMGFTITGRPSKSTVAITEKLKRETIRLNQIQDIAGCRVLVRDLVSQDNVVESMQIMLSDVEIDDKRLVPTNGYRAVHVIATKFGRPVEIQVRTALQHAWAEISEKVADDLGHSIKYGSGDPEAIEFLEKLSKTTSQLDEVRHRKLAVSNQKAREGKSKQVVRMAKRLSEEERVCIREIHGLFSRKPIA